MGFMATGEKGKNRVEMDKHNCYHVILKQKLSRKRYDHSVAVAKTARALAKEYGHDQENAFLAGLLHDYAREIPPLKLLELAKNLGLKGDGVMNAAPVLWHGPIGALLVERELGINQPTILEAIRYHTTGAPNIGEIAKAVFLADLIEPGRKYSERKMIEKEAFSNLNEGIFIAYELLMGYHIEKGALIHPLTLEARNELLINKRR